MTADRPFANIHVVHSITGRVRLRVPRFKSNSYDPRGIQALLTAQEGILDASVNPGCHSVTIVYDPAMWTLESLYGWLQDRRREELEEYTATALAEIAESQSSINWLQPWHLVSQTEQALDHKAERQPEQSRNSGYLTVGYASLALGAVLLPIPLLPGIPFLIFSSYCFAKAAMSPVEEKPETEEHVLKQKP